ncbi:PepSY domain-containing protein [Streptomyces sp. DSM 44915]|uniref:PepSY domain-containing protein n=1 Tax=Streptomyces chisholmiae TaxID=3075540 RepID=A0ABU2JNX7_9ACTN|nr:PepSY domain-containing protein [Streptomyces sp. DSM 44915]MDT0266697.1 PepSY domain-containing protein [Streptomyces sp. DSM 44915]
MTTATPDTPASPEPPPEEDRPAGPRSASLRPLVLRLHFYAGLLVAPFLFVAAFSGLLYAGSVQVEKLVYDHELSVPVGDAHRPVDEQIAAARAAYPEGTLDGVRPAAEPGDTTRVLLDLPDLGPSHRLAVFVDPYTAEVRGDLEAYGSSGALPFRWWIDELHRGLHLGDFGRHYSELAASWLAVITLGGLFLWLGQRRRRRARGALLPEPRAKGRRRLLSWHGSLGLWIALPLCFLALTGLTWSQHAGANITQLRGDLSWETPTVNTAPPGSAEPSGHGTHGGRADGEGHGEHGEHGEHAEHPAHEDHLDDGADGADTSDAPTITPGQAWESAREAGLRAPVEIVYPTEPGGAYAVQEVQAHWPTQVDAVAVDAGTGEVTDTVRFADFPLAAKLARWGVDAHMGLLFGFANQLLLMLLATALMTLIVLGYRMWWRRRPTGEGRRGWARPPSRGAWRRAPRAGLLLLLAVAAVAGYFAPLLGLSLLAFLLLDAVLGAVHRHRVSRDPHGRETNDRDAGDRDPHGPEANGRRPAEPNPADGGPRRT